MKNKALRLVGLLGIVALVACDRIVIPGHHVTVETVLRTCQEAKYDDPSGMTLGFERVHWENKLVNVSSEHLPAAQKRMYEQQFTATPKDKFLVFDVYLKNNTKQPLAWNNLKAPVFLLKEKSGTTYNPVTDTTAMNDITSKIFMGQDVNPNRTLTGTKVFDVPPSGSYQLEMSLGRYGGGWSLYGGGAVIMRCIVSAPVPK